MHLSETTRTYFVFFTPCLTKKVTLKNSRLFDQLLKLKITILKSLNSRKPKNDFLMLYGIIFAPLFLMIEI